MAIPVFNLGIDDAIANIAQNNLKTIENKVDIYLTDLETDETFTFPMLPREINTRTGVIFQSYTVLAIGNIKIPTGEELITFSWNGMFPGEARAKDPYIKEWVDPKEIHAMWEEYRSKRKKLRLLITETPINYDVYLERYTMRYSGGHGDYAYDITLTQAKDLIVYVSGADEENTDATADTVENKPQGQERPTPPPDETYEVAEGDSLWTVAQREMGDGSRYDELYEANKDVIDPPGTQGGDKYTLKPGQTLTIPA